MKIKVKDLKPNPFRRIERYPIDKAKVEALKNSIQETDFWDNILARKKDGKYEIAYGHHRLLALQELGITEVDIPVRGIEDTNMLKIMAEENLDWSTSPAVINETVLAVKEFVDKELAKGWKDCHAGVRVLFKSKHAFEQARRKGTAGERPISKFLGSNWSQFKIAVALKTLSLHKEGIVERGIIEKLPTVSHVEYFQKAVDEHQIPKPAQKKIVEKILKESIGKRAVQEAVEDALPPQIKAKIKKAKDLPTLDEFVRQLSKKVVEVRADLKKVKGKLDNIESPILYKSFLREIKELGETITTVMDSENGTKRKVLAAKSD